MNLITDLTQSMPFAKLIKQLRAKCDSQAATIAELKRDLAIVQASLDIANGKLNRIKREELNLEHIRNFV